MCGRVALNYTLPLLSRLLEDKTVQLRQQLTKLVGQPESLNISASVFMDKLYEDLHWLVLLAGHVLCIDCEGEVPTVPTDIMKYSLEQVN